MASLRTAGHAVSLLAPKAPGMALVGPGAGEVGALLDWDTASAASLLGDSPPLDGAFREALAELDVAVAYTRSAEVHRNLAALVPRVVSLDPSPAEGHASDWLARPAVALGLRRVEPPAVVPTPEEEHAARRWLEQLPRGFLSVHAGSGSTAKNWPVSRFAELAQAAPGGAFLVVLGPAEAPGSPLETLPGAVVARNLPARTLGAVLRGSGVHVGNDSGISHLAAAWGAPTLTLFGPTDPAVWAPVGPCVLALRSPTTRMQDLTLGAALAALQTLTAAR